MKKFIFAAAVAAVIFMIGSCMSHSAGIQRNWKSMKSDWNKGLDRTVTVYDYNGKSIKSWTGKFDVSDSEKEVWFDDANGKRVIIHGGIVINQEN